MGIRGLSTNLRGYGKTIDPSSLNKASFLIDGPSLAYHICDTSRQQGDHGGDYARYWRAAIETIREIESVACDLRIYFDGALPPEKLDTRRIRRRVQIRNNQGTPTLAPLMLHQLLLKEYPQLHTVIVPGEADEAIARAVDQHPNDNIVILSNDSDFFTYDFEKSGVRLMNLRQCLFLDGDHSVYVCSDIASAHRSAHMPTSLIKPPPKGTEEISQVGSDMPKMHELINEFTSTGKLISYLPVLHEDPNYSKTPAWNTGKLYRSYSYYRLIAQVLSERESLGGETGEMADNVVEYYSKGYQDIKSQLEVFDDKTYDYEAEIDPAVTNDLEDLLEILTDETCEQGPASRHGRLIAEYYRQAFEIDRGHNAHTIVTLSKWKEASQVYAQIQAALYSMMMLQSTGLKLGHCVTCEMMNWSLFVRLWSSKVEKMQGN